MGTYTWTIDNNWNLLELIPSKTRSTRTTICVEPCLFGRKKPLQENEVDEEEAMLVLECGFRTDSSVGYPAYQQWKDFVSIFPQLKGWPNSWCLIQKTADPLAVSIFCTACPDLKKRQGPVPWASSEKSGGRDDLWFGACHHWEEICRNTMNYIEIYRNTMKAVQ